MFASEANMILEDKARFKNPTILLVVDRTELEGQLKGWVERLLGEMQQQDIATRRTNTKAELQALLAADFRGLIISMIYKLERIDKDLCTRDNVYVFIDEAHRSIARDLGTYLMAAVPNATIIGLPLYSVNRCSEESLVPGTRTPPTDICVGAEAPCESEGRTHPANEAQMGLLLVHRRRQFGQRSRRAGKALSRFRDCPRAASPADPESWPIVQGAHDSLCPLVARASGCESGGEGPDTALRSANRQAAHSREDPPQGRAG